MEKDLLQKRYLSDNERYADLINGFLFAGSRKMVRRKKGISSAEFLSGFTKDSRLKPRMTLVLFYGECWDGSQKLHGILDFKDIPEKLRTMVNDYQIHLLEIRKLPDTGVFRTDLKQVFDFIRCSNDKEKLKELVEHDSAYRNKEEDAYEAVAAFTNGEEQQPAGKGTDKTAKVKRTGG